MINFFCDHLRQEVSQEAHETLNVLFASEEDLFTSDSRLPELFQCVPVIIVEYTLIEHQALIDTLLQVVHLLFRVDHILDGLAPCVFAVDEKLDRRVLMRLKFRDELLLEASHVVLGQHYWCDDGLACKLELNVRLQVVKSVMITLN